jgi:hypothetical protein
MEGTSSQNIPVQKLKVAVLPLYLACYGLVTNLGEIFTYWQVSQEEAGLISSSLLLFKVQG